MADVPPRRVAVVGAGAAGLAAAQRLRTLHPGLAVTVYEREAWLGGRAMSRTVNGATFDPGAQYVKAPTPELETLLTQTLAHDTLADIALPVWTFDGAGTIAAGDPALDSGAKWTYTDGLGRLGQELAAGLDVRLGVGVSRLQRAADAWQVYGIRAAGRRVRDASLTSASLSAGSAQHDRDERADPQCHSERRAKSPSPGRVPDASLEAHHDGDELLTQAEGVLLTPPGPASADIVEASGLAGGERLPSALRGVAYRRCVTWTFGYKAKLAQRPWYALVNVDRQHPISWLAYEHRKPGRPTGGHQVLLAQMAPGWSADHFEDEGGSSVADMLADLLGEEVLLTPDWTDRLAWRYALPDGKADIAVLESAAPGLFFAGDFTAGQGRVHLALEEGWRAAERIAGWLTGKG